MKKNIQDKQAVSELSNKMDLVGIPSETRYLLF